MKLKQQGFSLIELVIVIVILGLLAATAIPRFLNVTDDAENASVDGVSGGLATAVGCVLSGKSTAGAITR
jgi:MSHA pilin protein MshB